MKRIVEPELMNDPTQVQDYANANFEQADQSFIDIYKRLFPNTETEGYILDLGCGPGNVSFRLIKELPKIQLIGVDGSEEMIKFANIKKKTIANHHDHISFIRRIIPSNDIPEKNYISIVSNSFLHHLHKPEVLWNTINKYASVGTHILIVDLFRPANKKQALDIVNKHASSELNILQRDFYNSLLAAFTVKEVEQQLMTAQLTELNIKTISDRHIAIFGTKIN